MRSNCVSGGGRIAGPVMPLWMVKDPKPGVLAARAGGQQPTVAYDTHTLYTSAISQRWSPSRFKRQ